MFLKTALSIFLTLLTPMISASQELATKSVTIQGETLTESVKDRGYSYKSFVDKDGKINRYHFHISQIHYKNKDKFEDIDTRLTFNETSKTWEHYKASYIPKIPEYADGWFEFKNVYEGANNTIKARPVADHVLGVYEESEEGNCVLYKDSFGEGIDLKVYSYWEGLKKVVVINEKPKDTTNGLNFDFEIVFEDGSGGAVRDINGIPWDKQTVLNFESKTLKIGEAGKESFFKDAKVWDSGKLNEPVKIKLYKKDNKTYLRKTISSEILESSIYPVYTDHPTTYYVGAGDGSCDTGFASWATNHEKTSADSNTGTSSGPTVGASKLSSYYPISRLFLPVDTSGIDDSATISSATLYVKPSNVQNSDNDGDDWLNVVLTEQANPASLSNEDYDVCGSVTNPTEGATRVDLGTLSIGTYASWSLNSTGLTWVSKTGYTKLGMREGHDAINSSITANSIVTIYASETAGTASDPYLDVTVSAGGVPISQQMQFQGVSMQGVSVN